MILHQVKLIFFLKLTIWKRSIREIPIVYLILLSVFALLAGWALLRADISVTWKSLSAVAILQWGIYTRLKYRDNKKELLRQYQKLYPSSFLIDILLTTLPFLLVHVCFWLVAMAVAFLYMVFSTNTDTRINVTQPTIPSPFFPKSAFLWHSQFRVFLPTVWLFIVIISVIAYLHENFNLAIVVYCGGIFISIMTIILQKEERDFITVYLNGKHFRKRTTDETLASTVIFALPFAILLLLLFPSEWPAIATSFLCILLISVNLLWIKYIFYPSLLLASLFFFIGIFVQAVCILSPYGLVLIPFYYIGLYRFYKKRTDNYFMEDERADY